MKKSRKSGFMLAETIAVSAVVLGTLIIIYTQFVSINNSYYKSFKYNTVDNLYAVNNIKKYLSTEDISNIETALDSSTYKYIDLTACPNSLLIEYVYCHSLFDTLNAKTIIFTYENVADLTSNLNNTDFSSNLQNFIKSIKDTDTNKYRLIVEFNDDTFATLKVSK